MSENSVNPLNDDSVPDESNRPESLLAKELARYKMDHEALQQEFNTIAEDDPDGESGPAAVRAALIAAAPDAIREIISLSTMAVSESVRAGTSRYIIDVALGKIAPKEGDGDGLTKLLTQLTAKDTKKDKEKKSST